MSVRLKYFLTNSTGGVWGDEPTDDCSVPVLRSTDISIDGTWRITEPAVRCLSYAERIRFRLADGDLLVTKSSGSEAHIGKTALIAKEQASQGYTFSNFMQRLRLGRQANPRYVYYVLNNEHLGREQMRVLSQTTTGLRNLNAAILGEIALPINDGAFQTAIADFLDRETERIDALVEKKRRLIELLEEKQTALISHVVTKGLDPTVPMKYSGIPWLGTIPRHWDAAPVYSRYRVFLGKMLSKEAAAGPNQRPYLRNVNVQWDHMSLADVATMSFTEAERHKYRLRYGDLLVCEGGDVGRAAIWADELPDCYFQKALLMVRPRMVGELPRFLLMVLRAAASMNVFNVEGNQATFVHLTGEKLRGHRFGFPPAAEQSAIVQHIDRRTTNIDKTISRLQQQLALLAEHRQALITAAVTGQIDVKAQASDPEEVMS